MLRGVALRRADADRIVEPMAPSKGAGSSSPPHAPSRGGRSSAGLQQGKEPARAAKLDDYQARAPHKAPDVARALLLSVARTSASPSLACAWTDSRCCGACCGACSALL